MFLSHFNELASTSAAGLFFSPLGIGLFGVFGIFALFGPIALVLLVASAFGGRSRSHGDPSGLGIVVGFGALIVLSLAISAAVRW